MLLYADLADDGDHYEQVLTVLIPLVCLAVMLILAWAYKKNIGKKAMCVVMAVFVCAEAYLNTAQSLYQMHDDIVFSTRESSR